ncbi:MAG: GyrI-like domain-containing protein [Flavobacteriales bacterium]
MKKFLVVALFLVLVTVLYLAMNGLFSSAEVNEVDMPGYRIAGIEHRGPYEEIGAAFERIHQLADSCGIPAKLIGVYFDDPSTMESDSLRSIAGVIVSEQDSAKLSAVSGVVTMSIPAGPAAAVDFKTEGKLAMIIGAMKSYPTLTKHMVSSGKAEKIQYVYEVYNESSTRYVMQYKP